MDPETLPFAPGDSPFRLKGTGYRGHMKYAEANVPGGTRAMIDALRDPRLKAWFQQPFLASTFYDILPLLPAGRVCADLIGVPYEQYLEARTVTQAAEDLGGVYAVLLKIASTNAVALRLPRLLSQYFDFSKIETRVVAPGRIECTTSQLPKILLVWYRVVLLTYVREAILRGTKSVRVTHEPPEPDGAVQGGATVRFRWTIAWDAKE